MIQKALRVSYACFMLTVTLAGSSALADHEVIYRWLDPADGGTHFSETPPRNGPYDAIAIEHAAPVDLEVQRRLADVRQHTNEQIDARRQLREMARRDAELAAARAVDCSRARDRETQLESLPGRRMLVIDPDGNAQRMTEPERQETLAAVRAQVSTLCSTGGQNQSQRQ